MRAHIVGAVVSLVLTAVPALAQTQAPRPGRPYRGLFASGLDESEQSLVAQGSAGGGYDSNVLADLVGGSVQDPRFERSGAVGSVSGSLSYALRRDRLGFGASFGEATRYYPQNSTSLIHSYTETVGVTYEASRRTTLSANQFVAYQPFLLSSLFPSLFDATPGQLSLPPVDVATGLSPYVTFGANAGINQTLSRRVSVRADYNAEHSDTPYANASLSQQGGRVGLVVGLTRSLGLRVGYGRQEGRFASVSDNVVTETYDVGLDFQKALSLSRRTTLGFSSGTSALRNRRPQEGQGDDRTFFVTGTARLNHEIGRSWLASAAYDRSVRFLDVLLLPVVADGFSGNVTGLITRRLEFSSGVQGSIGTVGYSTQTGQSFDTYQAFTSLAYAFSRWANLNVSYSYYRYRFDTETLLPGGIARDFDRQSVRANINLWAPLMNKRRRN